MLLAVELRPTFPINAGPYGTYAKGGSETGMLGGMGATAAPPAPGAKPDVSGRLAQVGVRDGSG